ncbi:MAG TPA: NAD(P)H-dependent oxidoreductase subunit E [Telmatospirillum sp.]|nr:NAD(P)H-dependent oxidoreductase subunit E [Telmatospirillum sp.]
MENVASHPLPVVDLNVVETLTVDHKVIDKIVASQDGCPGALLGILKNVRNEHPNKYLPKETLEYISARAGIPLSQVYSVVTFYALFSLDPQGKNTVSICRGTACHTRGSRDLLEKLVMTLGLQPSRDGQADKPLTTADGKTTLRTVACIGQCALAPVVEINHEIFGHVNERTLLRELEALES